MSDHNKLPDSMLIFTGGFFAIAVVVILIYLGFRSPIEDEIVQLLASESFATYLLEKALVAPLFALSLLSLGTASLLFVILRRPAILKVGKGARRRKPPR